MRWSFDMQHTQQIDTAVAIGGGVTVGGFVVSAVGFFQEYNALFIGFSALLSISVGIVTLFHLHKKNRRETLLIKALEQEMKGNDNV